MSNLGLCEAPPADEPAGSAVPRADGAPAGEAPPIADAVGVDDLAVLRAAVAEIERLQAEAVALAGRLAGSGVCERTEGLPLDLLLAADVGMTGGDRHTLITAGQVLESMPRLARAHRAGQVSWSQVRHVTRAVRRRSREDRAVLDERIAATLERGGPVDPDAFVEAVDAAVDELVARRAVEERETRAAAANRLWAQQSFDGRVAGGFDLDAEAGATVLNAVAAKRGAPAADDPDREPDEPTREQRNAADALVGICAEWLAGGGGRRARPRFVTDVDVAALDATQPGRLRLRLPGPAPRMTARALAAAVEQGADVRVVVSDGAAPVAVTRVVRTDSARIDHERGLRLAKAYGVPRAAQAGVAALLAAVDAALDDEALAAALAAGMRPLCDPGLLAADDIPAATRTAVSARDGGCRFFGCPAPVDWTDIHHIIAREHGGDHHPDRLVCLCRRDHKRVHDHAWRLHLDPATGELVARRGTRTLRTAPRGSPLAPAPDQPARAGPADRNGRDRPPARGDPIGPGR